MRNYEGNLIKNEWLFSHGHSRSNSSNKCSSTYMTWCSMKRRCSDKSNKNYGGKGIQVCKEWADSFDAFLMDMGERPEGCTIDRIDSSLGYFKENCRWVNSKQQAKTRSTSVFMKDDVNLLELAARHGIPQTTIYRRYKQGYRGDDLICKDNKNKLRKGELSPSSKLSTNDIQKIKQMLLSGIKQNEIAKMFNVSQSAISEIKNGKTWSNL